MRNWREPARLGGMVMTVCGLGGCSADAAPWLPGGVASLALEGVLVLAIAAMAGALGWTLAGRRDRKTTHRASQQQRALALLAQAWPDPLALLTRPAGSSGPWTVLEASAAARAPWAGAETVDTPTLQAMLPPELASALQTPAEEAGEGKSISEADGWMLRHLADDRDALLLLWRCTAAAADESASLSYTVTHDLRAPIRAVEGFTRLIKEDHGSALDPVVHDHLDRVLGATARMNQMIDAMLALARLSGQTLARQPVNLSELAGLVIEDLRHAAPEREVSVQVEPGMLAQGDPTLLRQVLDNLLGNAWKYSAKQAHAQISFGREQVEGRSVYVVRDNGAGFDMRGVERLFGLFQRLHSASDFAGTGVGLASVRRIVQRHGGQVWAEGRPGQGAAFFFTLRDGMAAGTPEAHALSPGPAPAPAPATTPR